ncbi:hypothetical protein [Tessaracoccus flavus]|uniref:Uncharacterized protein n=1 Tax=Tessaracoccus flavus TaxID=1610493 RepID=A0A1Q2CHI5_9ACTN|nr:hypothetical protein [Tessaracoccus flavus]AQP45586.1 hypothetical protein RPIT_12860 [Tessaracoccus flavus]SDY78158.1 mannitol-1-phosphate 5-dehydrogenase [Tessaracoccus flavus]
MNRIVVFGAGSVGRGFIGQIFAEAGWRVTFVDLESRLVQALNTGSYRHVTLSDEGVEETTITGVDAIDGRDTAAVASAVASADFLATSVGAANLRHIAPTMAEGLRLRISERRGPVDILLAENLHGVGGEMRSLLADALGDDADAVLAQVGTLETSIGRMIPVPNEQRREHEPGWVAVEPYRELPLDVAASRAPLPDVPELVGRTDVPFAFYSDRKLYLHNLGHCLTAYLGELLGEDEIAEAIRRPQIHRIVQTVMATAAAALSLEYGEPLASVQANADDLLRRFHNRALHDTVERVGRDPQRKLAEGDRFLGALALAARHGLARPITVAVAVGADKLLGSVPADQRDSELDRIRSVVAHHGGEDQLAVFDEALSALRTSPDLERLALLLDP